MFRGMKLGLKPHDPARVRAMRLIEPAAVAADPLISRVPYDWAVGIPWDKDPLRNDLIGNCGPAAVINLVKMMCAVRGIPCSLTADDAEQLYRECGWDGTDAGDEGVVLLDLMHLLLRQPVGGITFDAVFRVGWGSPEHLATAVCIGPLIVGAKLTGACESTTTWDAEAARDPIEWGRHAYLYHSDSPAGGSGKSWGAPVWSTPEFRLATWREAYLLISRQLLPPGVDADRLIRLAGQL